MHHLFHHYAAFLWNYRNFHFWGVKWNHDNNNFNHSCSLVLIYLRQPGGYMSQESRALHMVWNWKLHHRYSLKKVADRWRHYHVHHLYFTDLKMFFLTPANTEKLCHQWTPFVKRAYWWNFQDDFTFWSQDIVLSLFFLI